MRDEKDQPQPKTFAAGMERVEMASKPPSVWQDYKFVNPVSKKVEPKQMYCEKLENTAVCAGIYKL